MYFVCFQFAAKQMERSAKKCEKEEKAEKVKLKKVGGIIWVWNQGWPVRRAFMYINNIDRNISKIYFFITFAFQAIQKGNMEGAKIYAENAIRQKNQVINHCVNTLCT